MQPRLCFLLSFSIYGPLRRTSNSKQNQNILEWLQILRKDFFLPRAQAEMNFSMEPVWTGYLSYGRSITLWRNQTDEGPTPNPSLKKSRNFAVPQRVAKNPKKEQMPLESDTSFNGQILWFLCHLHT